MIMRLTGSRGFDRPRPPRPCSRPRMRDDRDQQGRLQHRHERARKSRWGEEFAIEVEKEFEVYDDPAADSLCSVGRGEDRRRSATGRISSTISP